MRVDLLRSGWLLLLTFTVGCAHRAGAGTGGSPTSSAPDASTSTSTDGAPPLKIVPVIEAGGGVFKLELLDPNRKSTWQCSSPAKSGGSADFLCGEPRGWYRGPGSYQIVVEYKPTGGGFLQTFDAFDADPSDVREVLEIAIRGPDSRLITVGYKRARPGPEVDHGDVDPSVFGLITSPNLSRAGVKKELDRHEGEVWKCYLAELEVNPKLETTVTADFKVRPDGTVTDASGSGPATNPALISCVLEQVRRWKFPRPSGGQQATVSYPWKFKRP